MMNFQAEYLNKRAYSYLRNSKRILDIGCGEGSFIQLAPKQIVGIDSNKVTVKKCIDKGLNVTYGLATGLSYKDNSFDGVHCSHVVEHLNPDSAYKLLNEVGRVLRKEGIFVLRTPLLWEGFYDNLSHIKPYNPSVIRRYLIDDAPDTTFPKIRYRFEQIALKYRYKKLINFLYPLGIHSFKKNGYMIVLRKISSF